MRNLLKIFTGNSGVITIEFSFIYIIFIAFVFIIFEACKFFFVVVAMDYSLSQAAKNSSYIENKTSDQDYTTVFNDYFLKQNAFWVMFIDPKAIKVDASFCSSVSEATNNRCSSIYNAKKSLAVYSVSYQYRPLKIIDKLAWSEKLYSNLDSFLSRKVVYFIESSR
ncbi:hypothetical protein [Rosenbergiella epipactidis]|uniref:hypothetical protein n=1 Tax=Rosenbergiella epipactidis TaxID=1544694 RepID=UPI001F4DBA90|nr:hypothetical protein [Rosenbergiella epipactidis]